MLGSTPDRIHPVDVDAEIAVLEVVHHHPGLAGFTGRLLLPRLTGEDTAGRDCQHSGEEG